MKKQISYEDFIANKCRNCEIPISQNAIFYKCSMCNWSKICAQCEMYNIHKVHWPLFKVKPQDWEPPLPIALKVTCTEKTQRKNRFFPEKRCILTPKQAAVYDYRIKIAKFSIPTAIIFIFDQKIYELYILFFCHRIQVGRQVNIPRKVTLKISFYSSFFCLQTRLIVADLPKILNRSQIVIRCKRLSPTHKMVYEYKSQSIFGISRLIKNICKKYRNRLFCCQFFQIMNIRDQLYKVDTFFDNQSRNHLPGESELLREDHNYIKQNLDNRDTVPNFSKVKTKSPQKYDEVSKIYLDDAHQKHKSKIQTSWDTYTPYAFTKLPSDKKVQAFLQLFQDFQMAKNRCNEQIDKNKKFLHDLTSAKQQIHRLHMKENKLVSPVDRIKYLKEKDQQKQRMKVQIKRLHEKILSLTNNNKHIRAGSAKPGSKTHGGKGGFFGTQKVIVSTNQNLKGQLEIEKKKVRELIIINQQLKKNKMSADQQLKNRQMQQSVSKPRRQQKESKVGYRNQSEFNDYSNDLMRWKQKYQDLNLAYNKMNQDKDRKIKELTTQLVDLKENQRMKKRMERTGGTDPSQIYSIQERNRQLQEQKDKYESQIRRLTQMPFYKENRQTLQLQQKIAQNQSKCRKLAQQAKKNQDTSMKYYAQLEYKIKQNQMLKTQNNKVKNQLRQLLDKDRKERHQITGPSVDYNDFYRKLLQLVKLQGDDPVWKKFANIAQPQFKVMSADQLKKTAMSLWNDKLQLMAHLQRAKIQLNTIKTHNEGRINGLIRDRQNMEQELRIAKARLDQWMSMERVNVRRDFQIYQQGGVQYDDTVSVFQAQQEEIKNLEGNQNYFDLYLGQVILDENSLIKNPQNKIKNSAQVISFLTVDFYNHQTQHSDFIEGISKKVGNNYSFKVQVNPYFVKYLNRNSIAVQLWSPQGTSTVLLGRGQIWMKDLIGKSTRDIAPVVRGKCPIYHQDRNLIATVQYRLRMRLSISPFLEWAVAKSDMNVTDSLSLGRKRTLSITVERGLNFKNSINAFVYFTLDNQDYFSEPQRGTNPMWDYHRQIQLLINQDILTEFKQKYLTFTVFDDEKEINEDVYGIAKANLTPLIDQTNNLDLKLDVRSQSGEEIGKLIVKISWMS